MAYVAVKGGERAIDARTPGSPRNVAAIPPSRISLAQIRSNWAARSIE